MTLAEFLIDLGAWLIAIGLTLGAFAGLLWCMAKLCELGERK